LWDCPFLVLSFSYRSQYLINLAIPYFTDSSINFLGFFEVNTVQACGDGRLQFAGHRTRLKTERNVLKESFAE